MTTINLDGVDVVFEGAHRLRWSRVPAWADLHDDGDAQGPLGKLIGHVWPDRHRQPWMRRQIEHGRRTIIVLDGTAPLLSLPRGSVPAAPVGAEILSEDDEYRSMTIALLNWLGVHHRTRGFAFLADAMEKAKGTSLPLIEDDLVGTLEPLRFVFAGVLALGELRDLISRLYLSAAPATHLSSTSIKAPKLLQTLAVDTQEAA
jgi:hypothetical protein